MALNSIEKLRIWCQKVLPLVYDDSLSYYEVLTKVVNKLNEVIALAQEQNETIEEALSDIETFETDMSAQFEAYKTTLNAALDAFDAEITAQQSAFEGRMTQAFADFLADYEREFGITNLYGDSTTLAISQNQVSKLLDYTTNNNRFNPEVITSGKAIDNTGAVIDNPNTAVTGYIEVQPGENIVAQAKNNTTNERYQGAGTGTDVPLIFDSIAGYDEELAFVSGSFKSLVFNYQVPVGVKYIKLAMGQTILDGTNTDMSELSIVNSDGTIYPYQPYSEQNATVKMNALPVDDTTVGNHLWTANKINEFQAAVQGEFNQLETDLTGTVQGAIGDMNANFTQKSAELDTKFDTLEGNIQAEQEAFKTEIEGALASQKTELETEIGEVASDVQTLSGSVATQGQAITNLTGIVTNVEGRVDTLETDMTAAKADISDLETSDTQQTSDITDLKGRMTTAEGNINSLETASDQHTAAISNLQAKDAELVGDINGLSTRMGAAEGDIDLLEGRTDALETDVDNLETDVTHLEGDVNENTQDISDLNESFSEGFETKEYNKDIDITPSYTAGFLSISGTEYSYEGFQYTQIIPVNEGDIVTPINLDETLTPIFRVVCAYNGNTPMPGSGIENRSTYVVPAGINGVALTVYVREKVDLIRITRSSKELFAKNYIQKTLGYMKSTGDLSDGEMLSLPFQNVKNDCIISFDCRITEFGSIKLGKYLDHTPYVTIDDTNLTVVNDMTSFTVPHGLTIANTLGVRIENKDSIYIDNVTIESNGETFKWENANCRWIADDGEVYVISDNSTLTNCVLGWTSRKINAPIWLFGDSYISFYTPRWVYYLIEDGFTDGIMFNGYAGENSQYSITALKNLLNVRTPNTIVWCLGMNDADSASAVNKSWKKCYDKLIDLSHEYGFNIVLATIPAVPSILNNYKNAIVRNSGYQFIDFAAAVNVGSSGEWIEGTLSEDNVHPTIKGAKVLYSRAVSDCPQLTTK